MPSDRRTASWERIYLTEGADGFQVERRGRGNKGRPTQLPPKIEEDLLGEVQRLRAEKPNQKWVTDVTEMLHEAFAKIPGGTNLILHSDQGWQYQHKQYRSMLKAKRKGLPPAIHRQQALSAA